MNDRKRNLEKSLAPQINAGKITLQVLQGNVILVTETGETAFSPGSAVVKQDFISTIQALADQRAEAIRNMFLGMGVSSALVRSSGNANSNYLDGRVELVINPVVQQ